MPFKHKNIEYGLPHEQYPQEEINRCIDIWKEGTSPAERTGGDYAFVYKRGL